MKKLPVNILISLGIIISLTAFVYNTKASSNFSDVSERYKEAVDHIVQQEYARGISSQQYGTTSAIKRIDAAVMVAKLMGFTPSSVSPASGFTDVPADRAWAVNALKEAEVVNGKTAKSFGSQHSMTRSEMAGMLASAYQLTPSTDEIPFTDVNPRFRSAVAALVEMEITFGKGPAQFGANDNITRGEFALLVYRADLLTKDETPPEVIAVD